MRTRLLFPFLLLPIPTLLGCPGDGLTPDSGVLSDAATQDAFTQDAATQDAFTQDAPLACDPGYEAVDGACVDIDECNAHTSTCTTNQHCTNEPGTFSCHDLQTVSLANGYSCGLFEGGALKCWGYAPSGSPPSTGIWGGTGSNVPPVNAIDFGGQAVLQVATNEGHACVILEDHSLRCFGGNNRGQLGYGDLVDRFDASAATPVDLGPGRTALSVSLGFEFTCAVLDDHSVKCWGLNRCGPNDLWGQLGYGGMADLNAPPAAPIDLGVGRTALAVSAGYCEACALLDDHSVKCWGANTTNGLLGYGDTATASYLAPPTNPINLGAGRTAEVVDSSGISFSCALLDDDSVRCWGNNNGGGLGYGDMMSRSTPGLAIDFGASPTVAQLAVGYMHSCVRFADGSVKCWGLGNHGVLGLGDQVDHNAPTLAVDLGSGRTATRIFLDSKGANTCALLDDQSLKCWGDNTEGELGVGYVSELGPGGNARRTVPTLVNLRGY